MKRLKMNTPDDELMDQRHPMKTRFGGQKGDGNINTPDSDTWGLSVDIKYHIVQILTSRLSPLVLKHYKAKLEILRKCSYYIEVSCYDLPQHELTYLSHSTMMHLIDPWKFQRMKKMGNSQVKLQLSLLEELHEELHRGREELESILMRYDPAAFAQEDALLRQRIGKLCQAAEDFESVVMPCRLHTKHQLISDIDNTKIPQIRLALGVKMPVLFDKAQSMAFPDSAVLHWHIARQEQQEPGQQFEIQYKLLQPANSNEGNQMGTVTCSAYCVQINNLIPDKTYEFTVKRLDSCCLVYGLWTESIILRTISGSAGGCMESHEKKRRLFPW